MWQCECTGEKKTSGSFKCKSKKLQEWFQSTSGLASSTRGRLLRGECWPRILRKLCISLYRLKKKPSTIIHSRKPDVITSPTYLTNFLNCPQAPSIHSKYFKVLKFWKMFSSFLEVLGLEFRASCLLGRHSISWSTHWAQNVFWVKMIIPCWAPVAHTCNPSYSGGRNQEDRDSKLSPGKQFTRLSRKKKPAQKKSWQSDSSGTAPV
jgi:hypothetical protein